MRIKDEADSVPTQAVEVAIQAFRAYIEHHGGTAPNVLVMAQVKGLEPSGVTGGDGDLLGEPESILSFLLAHAMALGEAIGVDLQMLPFIDPNFG